VGVTLPKIGNKALIPEWFPTPMQAFIFRNWSMVSAKKIASVLRTSEENVITEAKRMGLGNQGDTDIWFEKGYITIIRSNWHLLPFEQLFELLGWDEEKFAYILKEEDFLGHKLGPKPDCEWIKYQILTDDQLRETEKIKKLIDKVELDIGDNRRAPFDFIYGEKAFVKVDTPSANQFTLDNSWFVSDLTENDVVKVMANRFINNVKNKFGVDLSGDKHCITLEFISAKDEEYHELNITKDSIAIKAGGEAGVLRALYRIEDFMNTNGGPYLSEGEYKRAPRFKSRYIYLYCGLYEGAFDVDSRTYCTDELLEEYARVGVNGIWFQALLYRLTEFKYAPEMSEGWQNRQEFLKDLIKRARYYGIKVYFYINEPRYMPASFFEKHPHLKGARYRDGYSMCTSVPETLEYLYEAVQTLCKSVPGIGGFFTITMSENPTHCKYGWFPSKEPCPRCADVETWKLVSDVNSTLEKAIHNVDKSIKLLAWDWAWDPKIGFSDENIEKCIDAMPEGVGIMCKRETGIPFVRGGIESTLSEYSISVGGLSEISKKRWKYAKDKGHETAVKLQINDTWECSTTPFVPVYRTVYNIIEELIKVNMDHLMISWTLGGYPSPNIKLISEAFFVENEKPAPTFEEALKVIYGDNATAIAKATDKFCDAFGEFPFDVEVVYHGPHNAGPANPLYHKPTGFNATMTCFAYDDLECWRDFFPEDVYENQFSVMSDKWAEGLKELKPYKNTMLYDAAYVSYSLFRSSHNQIRFIQLRRELETEFKKETVEKIIQFVNAEKELAIDIYKIMCHFPEVGYEAANHYYFNLDNIKEKIVNCQWLNEYYTKML